MPPHEQTNGGQPQNMASTASGGRFIVRTRISSELDEVKFMHHDAKVKHAGVSFCAYYLAIGPLSLLENDHFFA